MKFTTEWAEQKNEIKRIGDNVIISSLWSGEIVAQIVSKLKEYCNAPVEMPNKALKQIVFNRVRSGINIDDKGQGFILLEEKRNRFYDVFRRRGNLQTNDVLREKRFKMVIKIKRISDKEMVNCLYQGKDIMIRIEKYIVD